MPQPRTTSRTALSRLLFLAVLGWALVALGRRTSEETEGSFAAAELGGTPTSGLEPQPVRVRTRKRTRKKRLATSLAFATLFFAGAALSAGAGDMLVGSMEPSASEGDTNVSSAVKISRHGRCSSNTTRSNNARVSARIGVASSSS